MAEAILEGTLSGDLYPAEFALDVKRAKGSRTEADAVTGQILGVKPRTIFEARRRRRAMGLEQWGVKFQPGIQNPEIPMQHLPDIVLTTVEKQRHQIIGGGGKCGLVPYLFCATEVGHEGFEHLQE